MDTNHNVEEKPDDELVKELYARFGLAYYNSECLHRELCHLYAYAPLSDRPGITRPRLEERLRQAYSLTLGDVVGKLKGIVAEDFHAALVNANERRKFLAHHFWFEKCHQMFSVKGIKGLIEELNADSALFSARDAEAVKLNRSTMQRLGITDEMYEATLAELQSGDPGTDLMNKRKLKKSETIVRAWRIASSNTGHMLVLETDDGELWQFCDVGLGWSPFTKPESNWQLEKTIQDHLPALVNPRPSSAKPWHYEFHLKNKKKLWVRFRTKPESFVWGVSESLPKGID